MHQLFKSTHLFYSTWLRSSVRGIAIPGKGRPELLLGLYDLSFLKYILFFNLNFIVLLTFLMIILPYYVY